MMLPWKSPIHDETILTPLPYAPDLYLDGRIHSLPDMNLRDIYELPYTNAKLINSSYSTLLAATHLLTRAKFLRAGGPESPSTYRSLANRPAGGPRCLRIENQAAYNEIMETTKYIHANLPDSAKLDMLSPTPWTNPDVPIIVCPVAPLEAREWATLTDTI
jgi:hypothetical protein